MFVVSVDGQGQTVKVVVATWRKVVDATLIYLIAGTRRRSTMSVVHTS